VCYDGFLLSHTTMPVTIPVQATVDEFLPPSSPLTIIDLADPRNIGQVTLPDPRVDSRGALCHGYMEFRALHQQALLDSLQVIPQVDEAFGRSFGRTWGGLTWSHLLDDAEVVFVAAGSLGMELTVAAEELRAEGVRAGVLGIRAYRPFPVEAVRSALEGRRLVMVFDKAVSYGYEGPICSDLRAALSPGAQNGDGHLDGQPRHLPVVYGAVAGLGGREVTASQLADAARRALSDLSAGVQRRPTDWINLKLQATV